MGVGWGCGEGRGGGLANLQILRIFQIVGGAGEDDRKQHYLKIIFPIEREGSYPLPPPTPPSAYGPISLSVNQ